jgi:CheY-like chemotaxis protein
MPQVLVVEDDEDTRTTLCHILSDEGYQPVAFEAGDGAIDYLASHNSPCLVLLDLKLPRVGGLEVLQWLTKQPKLQSVRIAIITAERNAEEKLGSAFRDHVVRVLEKPFDLSVVLEMLEDHCGPARAASGE